MKIDQQGWHKFDGLFCGVVFEGGISTRELTDQEIKRIGGIIKLVTADDEARQVGPSVDNIKYKSVSAPVSGKGKKPDFEGPVIEPDPPIITEPSEDDDLTPPPAPEPLPEESLKYSRETLNKIAEEKGIKGIREVAKLYNVKGVQISNMIEDILLAQVPVGKKELS